MSALDERPQLNVRLPSQDLEAIKAAARQHNLPVSEYVRRTALGENLRTGDTQQTLQDHEERLLRLEELAYSR